MIPVQTKVRNKSTDWDLTSSLTGTVKRRPASQESCKSISPTSKIDSHLKFSTDNVADGNNDNAKNIECKINKQQSIEGTSSERNISSPQEIAQGNCLSHNEGNVGSSISITSNSKKINNPPQKKRSFFDLRHTAESASNKISAISSPSFASKLKLPKNISLSHLSPRRSAASRKLAQLEKQNNLFIRDGQPPNTTDKIEVEQKINKQNSLIFGNNKAKQQQQQQQHQINSQNVSIENMEAFNLKQQQQQQYQLPTPPTSSMATKSESAAIKNKKSSLIPAFLSGGSSNGSNSTKSNNNNNKTQSTSAAIKKTQSQGQGHSSTVSQKLSKTGIKFKELYRDFPSDSKLESKKRHPPPYREPPPPPSPLTTIQNKQVPLPPPANSNKVNASEKKIRFTENVLRNYEEIDDIVMVEDDDDVFVVENGTKKGNKTNIPEVSIDNGTVAASNNEDISMHMENVEQSEDFDKDGNLMAKPEYSSNVFKNIPVRAKKGAVPHMENYCLFDPMDFTNEKDFKQKSFPPPRALMSELNPSTTSVTTGTKSRNFQLNIDTEENIEDVIFEDELVYDISEQDERTMHLVAHHNYYEIDPELLEEDEMAAANACQLIDHNRIEQDLNQNQTVRVGDKKSKIYCNTSSTSSSSNSTSQTSTKSSTSTTSSSTDYPSLFNSVIETTHSSTMESTDENDSNGYGKVKKPMLDTTNQINVSTLSNESVITISNTVTCGDSEMTNATGATKKKSPQLDRIIRQTSLTKTSTQATPQHQQSAINGHCSNKPSLVSKTTKSSKINLPFYNKTLQLDSLKSSHSLPQLQNITVNNRCRQQKLNKTDFNFVIDNTTTIQLRKQYYVRQGRPQSSHSDADSGFLSPVTPPDSHQQTVPTNNLNVPTQPTAAKSESTLLNQCDNIQQLIEVSFISVIIIIGIRVSLSQ